MSDHHHDDDDATATSSSLSSSDEHVHHDPRVIGGEEAIHGRYPYMVNIVRGNGSHLCGGSIISPNLVLTAAHCGGPDRVELGRHDISLSVDDEIAVSIKVKETTNHPSYKSDNFSHDVAVIELEEHIEDWERFQVGRIATNSVLGSEGIVDGTMLTVIGWGMTEYPGYLVPGPLHEAALTYITNEECATEYGYPEHWIQDDMMCTWEDGKDACIGDSGSPLIIKGEDASQDLIVGSVSWGYRCAEPFYPGVYGRMDAMTEWINEMICTKTGEEYCLNAPTQVPTQHPTTLPTAVESTIPTLVESEYPSTVPSSSPSSGISTSPDASLVLLSKDDDSNLTPLDSEGKFLEPEGKSNNKNTVAVAGVLVPVFVLGLIGLYIRRKRKKARAIKVANCGVLKAQGTLSTTVHVHDFNEDETQTVIEAYIAEPV